MKRGMCVRGRFAPNAFFLPKCEPPGRWGVCDRAWVAANCWATNIISWPMAKIKAIEDEVRKEALSAREWPLLAPTLPPPSANTKRM